MSTRTILEVNHDQLHDIEQLSRDELIQIIRRATDCNAELDSAKGYGVPHGYGIRTLATRHHSSRLSVVVQLRTVFDDGSPDHRKVENY